MAPWWKRVPGAPSIKVAEAAKGIESTERDFNIALMNPVAKICHLVAVPGGGGRLLDSHRGIQRGCVLQLVARRVAIQQQVC